MASSMGVSPIKGQYGQLHVEEVLFQGGSFGVLNPAQAATMTHAYTFRDRYVTGPSHKELMEKSKCIENWLSAAM